MSTLKAAQRKSPAAGEEPVRSRSEDELDERERFIILLRHGIAEERTAEKADEDRGLTAEGHARMKQIARGLEQSMPRVQAIHSSPLLRAVQTALWVSKGYRSRVAVKTSEALVPKASSAAFLEFVAGIAERRTIIVGHEPNLSEGVRALVGFGKSHPLELKKGGCYGVRLRSDGTAVLEWILPPRILRKLGE